MELFEEMKKHRIPDIRINMDEWKKEYANTYNIIGLNNTEEEKAAAAEDIISIYLLLQAKKLERG